MRFDPYANEPIDWNDDPTGSYDADELVRWAEMYGHPETWAKKAQAAHGLGEDRLRAIYALKDALGRIADYGHAEDAGLTLQRIARDALSGEKS